MNTIWDEVKNQIKEKVPDKCYYMWIHPIIPQEKGNGTLELECPNKFSLNWIAENYMGLLEENLARIGGGGYRLSLKVHPAVRDRGHKEGPPPPRQLSLPRIPHNGGSPNPSLNREFTFDRFVVGKCNEFAYSASRAMAQGGDSPCNPLFMLSNTGLGKSHLSQAIGHAILERNPRVRVFYITAEDFVNEMIHALRNQQIEEFKKKYRRSCDVLLLEEVHFLGGKEKTQLELGYTLDALAKDSKRIVFTSSLLPREITNLNQELSSRLTSGVIATLDPPDYHTRVKILQNKATEQGLSLPREVVHLLAERLTLDVRRMESALRCLKAKSELLKEKITLDVAEEVLKSLVSGQPTVQMEDIQRLVCRYFKVDPAMLRSRSRKKVYTYPRNIYAYLCRRFAGTTTEEIGRSLNRKHSTVVYASEVIERKMKVDRKVRNQVEFLEGKLKGTSR